MLNKRIFVNLANIWFEQNPNMKKYHLAQALGISKQYVSRAYSNQQGDTVAYKHIDKLMRLTNHAIVIYPGDYFSVVKINHEKILENALSQEVLEEK
tara:strand:+ start:204 stop:494 length:291 start_codon:yes stop_codon:yes gene_type:complete